MALILQLASVAQGTFLTAATFTIIGLLCWAVHQAVAWWPARHGA